MFIGKKQKFGMVKVDLVSFNVPLGSEGYNDELNVFTKDKDEIGTLFITKDENEDITFIEWCKENIVQGAGIKIELQELIEFLESKTSQD